MYNPDVPIIECIGDYASHWGLTDLYPENEKLLREWIESGKDFATTWWGSKKEIVSAKYEAEGDTITVMVSQEIDDLWFSTDLIEDAICELDLDWDEPSDDAIEAIRDEAMEFGLDDGARAEITLPRNSTYDEVMAATLKAWDETSDKLHSGYETLKIIVRGYYDYYKQKEE